jgi:dihydroflavonol-4-reductase
MRVLVTGASGFLGSWVVRALLDAGDSPRVVVRPTSNLEMIAGLPIEKREGDVLDRRSIERAARGVDAVIHVAGLVSLRRRDRSDLMRVNIEGTRNVLAVAAERGVRAVHTSSIAAIGFTDSPALRDEKCWLSPEMGAQYPYSASKLGSELVALELNQLGADIVIVNPGLLLGPGDLHLSSTRFVHHFLQGQSPFCPLGGTSLADVRNAAAAYPVALRRARAGERYILAGANHAYRDIFASLAVASGRHPAWPLPTPIARWWGLLSDAAGLMVEHPYEEFNLGTVAYSTRFNYCDSSKAQRELGYEPAELEALIKVTVSDHLTRSPSQGRPGVWARRRNKTRPRARRATAAEPKR